MKTIVTAAAALSGLMLLASGPAEAKSAGQCNAEAWQYANTYYNADSTVAAAALGAAVGVGVSAITHNNLWAGAFGGGAVGLFLDLIAQQQRKQRLHDIYYSYCINPPPPAAYTPPAPAAYDPGPPPPHYGESWWMNACASKYGSFRWSGPHAGQFKGFDGYWHWCNL